MRGEGGMKGGDFEKMLILAVIAAIAGGFLYYAVKAPV